MTCKHPGCDAPLPERPPGQPGRPPKYCADHQKKRGKSADPEADKQRGLAMKRQRNAAKQDAASEMRQRKLVELAMAIPVASTLQQAGVMCGISDAALLEEMRNEAGALFPGGIDADTQLALLRFGAVQLALTAVNGRHLMAPRDAANAAKAVAAVYEMLSQETVGEKYATIEVVWPEVSR